MSSIPQVTPKIRQFQLADRDQAHAGAEQTLSSTGTREYKRVRERCQPLREVRVRKYYVRLPLPDKLWATVLGKSLYKEKSVVNLACRHALLTIPIRLHNQDHCAGPLHCTTIRRFSSLILACWQLPSDISNILYRSAAASQPWTMAARPLKAGAFTRPSTIT